MAWPLTADGDRILNISILGGEYIIDYRDYSAIADLAATLFHEKWHCEYQSGWYRAASNINDYNPLGGGNDAELDAWKLMLAKWDTWILHEKTKITKDNYKQKARVIRELINGKIALINDFLKTGYGDAEDYKPYDNDKIKLLNEQMSKYGNETWIEENLLKNKTKAETTQKELEFEIEENIRWKEKIKEEAKSTPQKTLNDLKSSINHNLKKSRFSV